MCLWSRRCSIMFQKYVSEFMKSCTKRKRNKRVPVTSAHREPEDRAQECRIRRFNFTCRESCPGPPHFLGVGASDSNRSRGSEGSIGSASGSGSVHVVVLPVLRFPRTGINSVVWTIRSDYSTGGSVEYSRPGASGRCWISGWEWFEQFGRRMSGADQWRWSVDED